MLSEIRSCSVDVLFFCNLMCCKISSSSTGEIKGWVFLNYYSFYDF